VGGDPADHQFFNEPPKEVPHGYVCAYIPDGGNPAQPTQRAIGGTSAVDADKQAWLATYAIGPSHEGTHWPYRVDGKVTGKADPYDRPPKNRIELFLSSMLHCCKDRKEARSSSRPCDCKIIHINA
jgi:hypothetical protein